LALGERPRDVGESEEPGGDVCHLLQRRAEKEDVPHPPNPVEATCLTVVASATDNESAHAVANHDQLVDRHRPLPYYLIEEARQLPAVVRNVQAAVVAHVGV